jgi:L-arabinokinase
MGGFADYSGSSVLQHATAMRTYAMVTLTDTGSVELLSAQVESVQDILGVDDLRDSQLLPKRVLQSVLPLDMLVDNRSNSLVSMSTLRQRLETEMSADRVGLWRSYIVGVLHAVLQQSGAPRPNGIRVTLVSDLPWNTGLASSASVEMSTALAFGHALGLTGRQMDPTRLALLCQEVENKVVGANCGFMDHIAVAHAPIPNDSESELVGFRCRLPLLSEDIRGVALPQGMQVVTVESGVLRSVADPPYKQVRVASLMGNHMINCLRPSNDIVTQLCDIPLSSFRLNYQDHLPTTLSGRDFLQIYGQSERAGGLGTADIDQNFMYAVQAATAHPIEEHARVQMFENTLRGLNRAVDERHMTASCEILGELMTQSHVSYSKCGLGTAETDLLTQLILEGEGFGRTSSGHVVGAKISGGGGGGALAVLLRRSKNDKDRDAAFWNRVRQRYWVETGLTCVVRSGVSGCMQYHGVVKQ